MRRILTLAALVTLAGCGPAAEPAGAKPVGPSQAEPAGNALTASAEESAGHYAPGGGALGFGGTCTITATDDGVDADGDEIPDNGASVVMTNCSDDTRQGVVNASYSVDDTVVEAGPAVYPFNFTLAGAFNVTAEGADGVTGVIDIDREASFHSDANSVGGSDDASVAASLSTANWSISSDEGYAWDTTYTMTTATFGDGTLTLEGGWNIEFKYEQGEDEYRAYANSVVSAGAGLTLSAACPTHVVAGTLNATYEAGETGGDDGTAALVITWTGCGASNATWTAEATTPGS